MHTKKDFAMLSRSITPLLLAACLALLAGPGACGATSAEAPKDAVASAAKEPAQDPARNEAVRKLAQERLGHGAEDGAVKIVSVRLTPYLGLFEIVTEDHKLVYTDEKVSYLVAGRIFDMKNLKDLTSDRLEEIAAIKLDSLPLELAIKSVKGNGKRKLVVFSDSDCPFCRKLENELANVTDVTVYTFLFPIQQLHPSAPEHSRRIWCSADRLKAWNEYWAKNTLPEARDCDVSGLDRILKVGKTNGIQATPTLVFADGHVIPGALPAAQLEHNLGPR
jgi:thiol:disulfide interchange protein DsbC